MQGFAKLRSLLEDIPTRTKSTSENSQRYLRKLKDRQTDLRDSLVDVETSPERQKIRANRGHQACNGSRGWKFTGDAEGAAKYRQAGKLKRDSAETDNDGATPGPTAV